VKHNFLSLHLKMGNREWSMELGECHG